MSEQQGSAPPVGETKAGPPLPNRHGHDFSFSRSPEGYGACRCGAVENTAAACLNCWIKVPASPAPQDTLREYLGSIWDTLVESKPYEREHMTRDGFIREAEFRLGNVRAALACQPAPTDDALREERAKVLYEIVVEIYSPLWEAIAAADEKRPGWDKLSAKAQEHYRKRAERIVLASRSGGAAQPEVCSKCGVRLCTVCGRCLNSDLDNDCIPKCYGYCVEAQSEAAQPVDEGEFPCGCTWWIDGLRCEPHIGEGGPLQHLKLYTHPVAGGPVEELGKAARKAFGIFDALTLLRSKEWRENGGRVSMVWVELAIQASDELVAALNRLGASQ